ncbi:SCL-interrupting locus protein homolog [Polymixia lowei]
MWDPSPTGDTASLHLCHYRNPRLLVLEKALRLAHRHARQSSKPRFSCFLLGSISVDSDEEGVTVTLERFDPGRDQPGGSGKFPSALVPGDVVVPCVFLTQGEIDTNTVVQSAADLHSSFKMLQQSCSSSDQVDLASLLCVRGHVSCYQQGDILGFSLRWEGVTCANSLDMEPIRTIPIIPTALARNLTGLSSLAQPLHSKAQWGFLTMAQPGKLLLLLESDPKASRLPLVGVWLSGITHISNPQVWVWCLRFLFRSSLQDRVLSESGCFLLVLFSLTRSQAQFFQCGASSSTGQQRMGYQVLRGSQEVSLYQHVDASEGHCLQCELSAEVHIQQTEVFRELAAPSSLPSAPSTSSRLSVSDQDSGVEDEDLSPRPSPHPHPPAQQTRRVQPSVPELSLLMDGSFLGARRSGWQDPASSQLLTPAPQGRGPPLSSLRPSNRKSAPLFGKATKHGHLASSSSPAAQSLSSDPLHRPRSAIPNHSPRTNPGPQQLHSTPNSHLHQPCGCCPTHTHNFTPILHSLSPSQAPPPTQQAPSLTQLAPPPDSCPCSTHPDHLPVESHQTPPLNLASPSWVGTRPDAAPPACSCVKPCCLPSDAYHILLNQDRQLRALQAQIQMLLETQGKPLTTDRQTSSPANRQTDNQESSPANRQTDNQTSSPARLPPTTASVAVETGGSLFWGSALPCPPPEAPQDPLPSSPAPSAPHPSSRLSCGSTPPRPQHQAPCSPSTQTRVEDSSTCMSPVLGESASMFYQADDSPTQPDRQRFYQTLLGQVSSRLQASTSIEEESRRKLSLSPDASQPSSSSCSSAPAGSGSREQGSGGDPVIRATLDQLQRLGVNVGPVLLNRTKPSSVEHSSTLACINPAALLPRLSLAESASSSLFPGGSVDLSLEANAIALRYLSDSQLSRLSLGSLSSRPSHTSRPSLSPERNFFSPSNMSLATRGYMRRYGLIEEEEEEEEEQQQRAGVVEQEELSCQPLSEGFNVKLGRGSLLPQSQLIRDLRPKMQLLSRASRPTESDKENCAVQRPSLPGGGVSHQPEASIGNFLDLSRLKQLPKLF